MAVDQRKRQRKLARRAKKDKAKRKALVRQNSIGMESRIEQASASPILHCFTIADLWSMGIGNVLVSREMSHGRVAFAVFLVDVYCLGVKDAMADICSRSQYEDVYTRFAGEYEIEQLEPADAFRLVEGAVVYARQFGLSPHSDYRKARPIFGDIDPADSERHFEYGQDGKPCFIAGPNDSPERCQRILASLRDSVGNNSFHYIMPVHGMPEGSMMVEALGNDAEDAVIRILPR